MAVARLEPEAVESVCLVTTDSDAGNGAVTALETNGYENRVLFKDGFELIGDIT